MSVWLLTLRIQWCLVVPALVALAVCGARAGSRQGGRPIEYTEPRSDEVTTNLHQLGDKKDSLRELEADLYKPLQTFAPRGSLDGVAAPLPRSQAPTAIQSKRAKELLERRKNWVFMTPEDLLGTPTVERILKTREYGTEAEPKKDSLPMERYYERLIPKRPAKSPGKTDPTQAKEDDLFNMPKKSTPAEVTTSREEADLPSGLKESAEALRNMFGSRAASNPFAQEARPNSLSDPFGLGVKEPSKEQTLDHKKLMNDFRTMVDASWRPPAADNGIDSAFALAAPGPSTSKLGTDLPSISVPTPLKQPDVPFDVLNPVLGPPGLPDLNAKALGQTKPSSSLPKVQERRTIPARPDFTAPRRAF